MRKQSLLKNLLLSLSLLFCFAGAEVKGQTLLWGASPFQDSCWSVDTTTWTVVHRMAPSLAGFTITGITGMAYDPCENDVYVIMKVSGVSGRVLGKMQLPSGVCTQVGNLGDNFSTISFREDGQLFGVVGDGGTASETLFLIDKTNGTKTLAAALGNGADGEVISYNWDDDFFYHWSGNGTVVFEKVMSVAPYSVTNIPTVGAANGETFGAIYLGNSTFIRSTISSNFNRQTASGVYSNAFGSNPDDLRGLILPPVSTLTGPDTVCVGEATGWNTVGMIGYAGSLIYAWGDGTSDTLANPGAGSHTYTSAGTYYTHAVTMTSCGTDTLKTDSIVVLPLPNVSLSPNPAYICNGDTSVVLTGTSGGTSQWYQNGVMIGGATSNTFTVTASNLGNYNMVKTNQNGCADSAAVGTIVAMASPLTMANTTDTICDGDTVVYTASAGQDTYQWYLNGSALAGDTSISINATSAGIYSVSSTVGNCADSTGASTLVITPLPTAGFTQDADTVSLDSSGTVNFTDAGSNGDSWSWTFGDAGTSTDQDPSHTYTTPGTYTVTQIATNGCGSDTSTSTVVVLDTTLGLSNQLAGGNVSIYPNPNHGQFSIDFSGLSGQEITVAITDLRGAVVLEEKGLIESNRFTRSYDLSGVSKGFYLVKINSGKQSVAGKILVK